MKILIVFEAALPAWSGVVRTIGEQIKHLKKRKDVEIRFVHSHFRQIDKSGFMPFIVVGNVPIISFGFFGMRKYVNWADVIIVHETASLSAYALIWTKILGKTCFLWQHVNTYSVTSENIKIPLLRTLLASFAQIEKTFLLRVANKTIKWSFQKSVTESPKVISFPFCVDSSSFNPFGRKNINKFVVGFIGRLSLEKNIETVYCIAEDLLRLDSKYIFICIGDGKYRPPECLMNRPNFHWIKHSEQVEKYLKLMDCLLILSNTEVGPFVLPEAMACGVIPITTPVGICNELISSNNNGFIVGIDELHTNNIVQIIRNLSCCPKKVMGLRLNAIRKIRENLPSWDSQLDILLRIIIDYESTGQQ